LRRTTAIGLLAALAVAPPALWFLTAANTSTPRAPFLGATGGADTVDATGRLEPMMSVTVGSSDSGVIAEVFCDENARVKKGQVCARIDPRPFQAEVDQDRASLATAKAQLEKDQASLTYASRLAQRYRALVVQRAVSEDQLENAASSAAQAKAQIDFDEASVAQHAATLEAAEIALEYTNIVSPIAGVVVSRHAAVGETIVAQFQSPTLFVIASDLSRMQLEANIGEKYIDLVRAGDKVTYALDALPDRQFEGTVRQIRLAPQRDGNAVSYIVLISADNREGLFRPGMLARATIHIRSPAIAAR
jgi:HlyD family secretion protein